MIYDRLIWNKYLIVHLKFLCSLIKINWGESMGRGGGNEVTQWSEVQHTTWITAPTGLASNTGLQRTPQNPKRSAPFDRGLFIEGFLIWGRYTIMRSVSWSQGSPSSECSLITGCPLIGVSPDHRVSPHRSVPWSQGVPSSESPLITGCPLIGVSPDHRVSPHRSVPWSQGVPSSECPSRHVLL